MIEPITGAQLRANENSFLQRLKTATAPHHAALEAQPLLQVLMTPAVSRKLYRDYLMRMQKISQAFERTILPLLSAFLFAPKQLSSELIEEDLGKLFFNNETLPSLPGFAFSQTSTLPFAWGIAYVMEGSKLGGRVIFKHLQKTLEINENNGGAYLANKGADTGAEWKEFLQKLSAYTKAYCCEEELISGAIFGFASIHHYFETNEKVHDH